MVHHPAEVELESDVVDKSTGQSQQQVEVIYDDPGYLQTVLKQTRILIIKNFKLSYRKKVTTAIQLTVPFFFVFGLYLIQLAVTNALDTNPHYRNVPISYSNEVPNIPKCTPHPGKGFSCYSFIYAPDSPVVVQLVQGVMAENPHLGPNDIKSFSSADALNSFILNNANITQAAYVFNSFDNGQFNYDVQYNSSCIAQWGNTDGLCAPPVENIIAPMQVVMDRQIMRYQNQLQSPNATNEIVVNWNSGIFAHQKQLTYNIVTDLGSIFFFASLMFQFVLMLQDMVLEKETKLKEGMRMMGLKESSYYLSWFLTYMVFIILNVFLLIAAGYIFQFSFFKYNDFGTYFFLFIFFGFSIICFAFFLSACLAKSQTATFLGFFLFILFSILQAFIPNLLYIPGKPLSLQYFFSLFSPVVFAKGMTDLAIASDNGGIRWENICCNSSFPLILVYRWVLLDGVIFIILGWYIDNVFPGEFGTPKPFYFFLMPSYWTGNTSMKWSPTDYRPTPVEDEDVRNEEEFVNRLQNSNDSAVVIKNLVKVYRSNMFYRSKKDFYAVKGLSLTMEKNKLFCLLGPNGAGKTTTLSMLTGLFGPSKGDALIFGKSIMTDMVAIRKFMGVCPQHDLLWSHLTGREHLELYSAFKNVRVDQIADEANERLNEVGIADIADQFITVYSGGERRRLSVAIAMTGNPKIVFLDEPTTGMDPVARHQVWEIIERSKKNRAIVLTTHSMEEADILSDKIGIMAMGRLRCLGDNLHLKNKFGAGYKVTVFLKNMGGGSFGSMLNLDVVKNVQNRIISFVLSTLEGTTVASKTNEQIIFSVPRQRTDQLPYFLETLEVNQSSLHIHDIDVNLSTLEEVFLKIAEDAESERKSKL
ncbi:hypothetical protein SAMD00019534_039160 [Acytostelium subglobosum LB1]|uniref:hypothetical protein n=1 Tax=Acytostelium subglobosum LB1 TaxID=1410327 RepID=UPI0006448B5A|nr:hypothetical protein SAMD00019534_039160 [Acytostelium subglobosum LB1]GAM20741.1 hypothetical protein SAMD00019534_039160 [Acytostelium subglobosum LB1]|eukprot:XP_012755875.1 hypothetical protein SAMD00019534_039160 [Acytostelium subglobosum LB1]